MIAWLLLLSADSITRKIQIFKKSGVDTVKMVNSGKEQIIIISTKSSTKYQVPSTKHHVPSSKYQVPGAKYQAPSSKN